MVVSSNQIAQLLAQQNAMIMQSFGMAQQRSQQNPLARLEQAQITSNPMGAHAIQMGSAVSGAAASAAGGAYNATVGLSMLGIGPDIDPFSLAFTGATMGWRGAGALSRVPLMGGVSPLAGAIGGGMAGLALGGGIYMGASKAVDWIIQGVHQQTHMAQGMYANMGMAGMGMASSVHSAHSMANIASEMGSSVGRGPASQFMNAGSIGNLAMMGMQGGSFAGVNTTGQFRQKLRQLTSEAGKMAAMLKTSIDESYGVMQSINQQFGTSGTQSVGMVSMMAGAVGRTGMGFQQQMGVAGMGVDLFQSMGLDRASGAAYGLQLGQQIGASVRSGAISRQVAGDLGGVPGMTSTFAGAGVRALGSGLGNQMLMASMSSSGGLDMDVANQIISGGISGKDLAKRAKENMKGGRDRMFAVNREQMVGDFMSQAGSGGAIEMLDNLGADTLAIRQITGMSNRELGAFRVNQQANKQHLMRAASDGFKQGMGGRTIGEVMGRISERVIGPIRDRFMSIGQSMSQGISEFGDSLYRDMMGTSAPGASGTGMMMQRASASMSLGAGVASAIYGTDAEIAGAGVPGGIGPPMAPGGMFQMGGQAGGGGMFGGFFSDIRPRGMTHVAQGGSLAGWSAGNFMGGPSMAKWGLAGAAGLEAASSYGATRAFGHRMVGSMVNAQSMATRRGILGGLGAATMRAGGGASIFLRAPAHQLGSMAQIFGRGQRLLNYSRMATTGVAGKFAQWGLTGGARAATVAAGAGARGAGFALGSAGRLLGPWGFIGMAAYDAANYAKSLAGEGAWADEGIGGNRAEALATMRNMGGLPESVVGTNISRVMTEASGGIPLVGQVSKSALRERLDRGHTWYGKAWNTARRVAGSVGQRYEESEMVGLTPSGLFGDRDMSSRTFEGYISRQMEVKNAKVLEGHIRMAMDPAALAGSLNMSVERTQQAGNALQEDVARRMANEDTSDLSAAEVGALRRRMTREGGKKAFGRVLSEEQITGVMAEADPRLRQEAIRAAGLGQYVRGATDAEIEERLATSRETTIKGVLASKSREVSERIKRIQDPMFSGAASPAEQGRYEKDVHTATRDKVMALVPKGKFWSGYTGATLSAGALKIGEGLGALEYMRRAIFTDTGLGPRAHSGEERDRTREGGDLYAEKIGPAGTGPGNQVLQALQNRVSAMASSEVMGAARSPSKLVEDYRRGLSARARGKGPDADKAKGEKDAFDVMPRDAVIKTITEALNTRIAKGTSEAWQKQRADISQKAEVVIKKYGTLGDSFKKYSGGRKVAKNLDKYLASWSKDGPTEGDRTTFDEAMVDFQAMDEEDQGRIVAQWRTRAGGSPAHSAIVQQLSDSYTFSNKFSKGLNTPSRVKRSAFRKDVLTHSFGFDPEIMDILKKEGAFKRGFTGLRGGAKDMIRGELEETAISYWGQGPEAQARVNDMMALLTASADQKSLEKHEMSKEDVGRGARGVEGWKAGAAQKKLLAGKGAQAFDQAQEELGGKLSNLGKAAADAAIRIAQLAPGG